MNTPTEKCCRECKEYGIAGDPYEMGDYVQPCKNKSCPCHSPEEESEPIVVTTHFQGEKTVRVYPGAKKEATISPTENSWEERFEDAWENRDMTEELINNMKLCLLCLSSEEHPYTETDARLHEKHGLHHTVRNGHITHWAPLKGHAEYEAHSAAKNLGLIKSI